MTNQPAYFQEHRVRFQFRKSRTVASGDGTIYAMVYVDGHQPLLQTTDIRAQRVDWDNRTTPRNSPLAKELNEKIEMWRDSLRSAAYSLRSKGERITPRALMDEITYADKPQYSVVEVVEKFVAHKKATIGHDRAGQRTPGQITHGTYRTYEIRLQWLIKFLKAKRTPNLTINKIDSPLLAAYHHFLMQQPKVGAAHASNCIKFLNAVCEWAILTGLTAPMLRVKPRGTTQAQSRPHNVIESEVRRMELLVLPPSMTKVRDGWLLARELCLHYSDYMALRARHFSRDARGRLVFEKPRTKQESGRNIRQISLVSERAQRIWQQYGEKLPVRMSNAGIGRLLKDIGKEAQLERPLTFSHARDSGIFRLVAAGCSDAQIRLAAGWTSTKQLARYVNHDRRLLDELVTPDRPKVEQLEPERSNPFVHIHRAS
jgi:hypothetical protein